MNRVKGVKYLYYRLIIIFKLSLIRNEFTQNNGMTVGINNRTVETCWRLCIFLLDFFFIKYFHHFILTSYHTKKAIRAL